MSKSNKTKFKDKVLVFTFLIFTLMPILAQIFEIQLFDYRQERRILASMPDNPDNYNELKGYFKGFENYYNDHFGLRQELIFIDNYIDYKVFPKSYDDRVVYGQDNWLFYKPNIDRDNKKTNIYSQKELEEWRIELEDRQKWLGESGVEFYFVIAPNKSTIYPELINKAYTEVNEKGRIDQFVEYMNRNSSVKVVDLRQSLIQSKNITQLYLKGDTHWNDYGAFVGYQELSRFIKKDFPNYQTEEIGEFELKDEDVAADLQGLYHMLLLGNLYNEKTTRFYIKNQKSKQTYYEKLPNTATLYRFEHLDKKLPKAMIFRDSFSDALLPFYAESFSKTTVLWSPSAIDKYLISQEKPDIVIQQMVERRLHESIKSNSSE